MAKGACNVINRVFGMIIITVIVVEVIIAFGVATVEIIVSIGMEIDCFLCSWSAVECVCLLGCSCLV